MRTIGPKKENKKVYQKAVEAFVKVDKHLGKKDKWTREEALHWSNSFFLMGKEIGSFKPELDKQTQVENFVAQLLDSTLPRSWEPYDELDYIELNRSKVAAFIKDSGHKHLMYDALKTVAALFVRHQKTMSPELSEWAATRILGGNKRPIKKGKYSNTFATRNYNICQAVNIISRHGRFATKNEATKHVESSCDIVAETLETMQLTPTSYSEIEKIYKENKHLV